MQVAHEMLAFQIEVALHRGLSRCRVAGLETAKDVPVVALGVLGRAWDAMRLWIK